MASPINRRSRQNDPIKGGNITTFAKMEESNGFHPLHQENKQANECTEASSGDIYKEQLSPNNLQYVELVVQKILSGEASFDKDDAGNPILVYKNQSNIPVLCYVEKSQANLIATPLSEKDTQNRIDACLEMINFLKNNQAPNGVLYDQTKVRPYDGKYREGHEFIKLDQIPSSGGITVVKDKKTGTVHVLKKVMISWFREEEVRALVDLDGENICPSLYLFYMVYNYIFLHMEKLDRAITLTDVIDSHMQKLCQKEPDLVRPFSLYVFHGLLSTVNHMHDKNWTHRDLHGGNVMLQEKKKTLHLKVVDFGNAERLRGKDGYNLKAEKDDIYQVIRLFSAIYVGQLFDSGDDLKDNYRQKLEEIQCLSTEAKKELFELIEAAMSVAESGKRMEDTIQKIGDKLGEKGEIDDMMKRVAAILFNEDEYMSLHGDLGVKCRKEPAPLMS